MLFRSLVAVLGLLQTAEVLASPLLHSSSSRKRDVPHTHAIHERHTSRMSDQWVKRDKLPGVTVLPVRIGLRQSNLDKGHGRLVEM